jgi:hypothetical protein
VVGKVTAAKVVGTTEVTADPSPPRPDPPPQPNKSALDTATASVTLGRIGRSSPIPVAVIPRRFRDGCVPNPPGVP